MSKTENSLEILETLRSERDADLDGTYPRSQPHGSDDVVELDPRSVPQGPVQDAPVQGPAHPDQRHRPYTTSDQWRSYSHTELDPPDLPQATTPDRYAAQLALASVRRGGNLPLGPQPGTLLDPNGRAVVSSRSFSPNQVKQYKVDNPGSYIYGVDDEPTGSAVAS